MLSYILDLRRNNQDLSEEYPLPGQALELDSISRGKILVEDIHGEIEANNGKGNIELFNISGAAVVHAAYGDIEVSFKEADSEKAMSFSTHSGSIDVCFPSDLQAKIAANIEHFGQITNEFQDDTVIEKFENPEKEIYRPVHYVGMVNGGRIDLNFTTLNGDIIIRSSEE